MNDILKTLTIKQMLKESFNNYKNMYAYKLDEKNITYKELYEDVNNLGTELINLGLKDKRIAIIGQNSYQWEVAYLSIVCGAGIVVPLDKMLPENELESLIKRSNVEAIFFDKKYEDSLRKISLKDDNNLKTLILMDDLKTCNNSKKENDIFTESGLISKGEETTSFENIQIDENKMAILLFTSGTTSKSKAVMLSNKNICSNINAIKQTLNVNETDTFLSVLPLHHVFECTVGFLFPLSIGAKIVFGRGIRYIIEDMKLNDISVLLCVPAIYENIYKNIRKKFEKEGKLDSLEQLEKKVESCTMSERKKVFRQIHEMLDEHTKLLISGAAALDPEVEKGFRLWGFNLVQGYGLTETSPVIAVESDKEYRLSSIGRPLPGIQAKIINENEEGIGELVVKGDNVMLGYLEDEEATNKTMKNGWLCTGDLARIDEDGYIYICGRKKSVIVLKNGKNIFPEEMEKLVNKIDGVKESLIFGRCTSKNKNDIKLNVEIVFDKNQVEDIYHVSTIDEIYKTFHEKIKQVNSIMPRYKAIQGLICSEEPLIKTSTNKIKRNENIARINEL